jgi:hypothetical protein
MSVAVPHNPNEMKPTTPIEPKNLTYVGPSMNPILRNGDGLQDLEPHH